MKSRSIGYVLPSRNHWNYRSQSKINFRLRSLPRRHIQKCAHRKRFREFRVSRLQSCPSLTMVQTEERNCSSVSQNRILLRNDHECNVEIIQNARFIAFGHIGHLRSSSFEWWLKCAPYHNCRTIFFSALRYCQILCYTNQLASTIWLGAIFMVISKVDKFS